MKIDNIKSALDIFVSASEQQAIATENGDYKTGNKCYDKITKAAAFLKSENAMDNLYPLLSNSSIGVRLWAACYLLPVDEQVGLKVLEDIAGSDGIHSLTAETTINEWQNGNLKF